MKSVILESAQEILSKPRSASIPKDKLGYFKSLSARIDAMLQAMERGEKVDQRLYHKLEDELERFLDDAEHAITGREEDEDSAEDLEPDYENSISLEDDLANIYATWKFGYSHWDSEDEVATTIWDVIDDDWFKQEPQDTPRPVRSNHSTAQLIDLAKDAWQARQKRLGKLKRVVEQSEARQSHLWTSKEINFMLDRAKAKHGRDACIRLDDKKYSAGDKLPPSRQWDDGAPTDDVLDGTSVIGYPIQSHHAYRHAYAYVVKGDGYASGYDDGELVCLGAKVIEVL